MIRNFRRKPTIKAEEWDKIEEKAKSASYFLNNKRFKFIQEYINASLNEIEQLILNNSVKEVHEESIISDKFKKIFVTPKKVQVDELIGAYKWIKQFMADLEFLIIQRDNFAKKAENKEIEIERSKEI